MPFSIGFILLVAIVVGSLLYARHVEEQRRRERARRLLRMSEHYHKRGAA